MKARGVETKLTGGSPPGLGRPTLASRNPERTIYRVVGPHGRNELVVHNNSLNNLVCGLVRRVFMVEQGGTLVPTPQPLPGAIERRLAVVRKELGPLLPKTAALEREVFVQTYTGRRLTMYQNALESLRAVPLGVRDSRTSTFLKAEKVPDKAPRVIQPRNTRFHIELGIFIKPIEHRIYGAIDKMNREGVVAKCLNLSQRGQLIAQKWASFKDPVALGLDASRFDQHVSVDALRYCHSVYLKCFPDRVERDQLRRILEMTIDNSGVGYAKDGSVPYTIRGCRMSGDMDTALGNVLLMCSMIMALRRHVQLDHTSLKFINDGDDAVLFMERKHLRRVSAAIKPFFTELGFTMKVEEPVYVLERVEFCQTRPVVVQGEYRMVRIPQKAMAKDLTCILDISQKENFSRWVRAVGECGMAISGGLPVFQEFYSSMRCTPKLFRGTRNTMLEMMRNDYKYNLYRGMDTKRLKVSEETRASFYLAFGIEPSAQRIIESTCMEWTPRWEQPKLVGDLMEQPDQPLITLAA